jgi:hypothetical protein
MTTWKKVLTLEMMRDRITYYNQRIKCRVKNKKRSAAYILENGKILPIVPNSGKFIHILYMERGFPIDVARQILEDKGLAADEEQLQMCINNELIKQIKARERKNRRVDRSIRS